MNKIIDLHITETQDLWEFFEPTDHQEGEVDSKALRKQNAAALHAIQISCAPRILSKIRHITSAKFAWDTPTNLQKQHAASHKEQSVEEANSTRELFYAAIPLEKICPGVLSCVDIIAVAARDAFAYVKKWKISVGSPSWEVKLGNTDKSNFSQLRTTCSRLRKERTCCRGHGRLCSHTLGQAQCFTFRERIYNHSNIDAGFASTRKRRCCPSVGT
ncbi:unnamed protein product [Dovyalis caffra]|uniref:peroxidase n=1 Tax=Dovyalis caffra TaxID=77055 RepID=A0AAV1QW14_9ROSI|nr:unnamed protein product [Dovyalis caffra]